MTGRGEDAARFAQEHGERWSGHARNPQPSTFGADAAIALALTHIIGTQAGFMRPEVSFWPPIPVNGIPIRPLEPLADLPDPMRAVAGPDNDLLRAHAGIKTGNCNDVYSRAPNSKNPELRQQTPKGDLSGVTFFGGYYGCPIESRSTRTCHRAICKAVPRRRTRLTRSRCS